MSHGKICAADAALPELLDMVSFAHTGCFFNGHPPEFEVLAGKKQFRKKNVRAPHWQPPHDQKSLSAQTGTSPKY